MKKINFDTILTGTVVSLFMIPAIFFMSAFLGYLLANPYETIIKTVVSILLIGTVDIQLIVLYIEMMIEVYEVMGR